MPQNDIPDPHEFEWAYAQRHITSPYPETMYLESVTLATRLVTIPGDTHACHVLFIPEHMPGMRDHVEWDLYGGWDNVTDDFRSVEVDNETERLFDDAIARATEKIADRDEPKPEPGPEEKAPTITAPPPLPTVQRPKLKPRTKKNRTNRRGR